jgi:superfamily II DNA helicase RecQ
MDFITHCEEIAKQHFAIDSLRPAQKEVFSLIEQKKYVLATLPTGSGKTLLYAIPSLIYEQVKQALTVLELIPTLRAISR